MFQRKATWLTHCMILLGMTLGTASSAQAAVIEIFPTIGPNPFTGIGSYATYSANALSALQANAGMGVPPATGAAGPGQYLGGQVQGPNPPAPSPATNFVITPNQITATNAPNTSWLGQANPGSAFGAAFANELGNFLYYGIRITGAPGETFNLAALKAAGVSTLTTNSPGLGLNPFPSNLTAAYGTYSQNNQGIDNVAASLGGVPVNSNNDTDPVDRLFLVGPALGFATAGPLGSAQAEIDAVLQEILNLQHSGDFLQFQFNINGFTTTAGSFNSNSVVILDIPEPGSIALWTLSVAGVLGYVRRRRMAV